MATQTRAGMRPVDAATVRLMELAAKGFPAHRIAREVEIIIAGWLREPDAGPLTAKSWLEEMREQIVVGVADAEEQVSYVDPEDTAAAKQAALTLAALQASRDAIDQASASL
jgi:hypothetical protein